MLIVLFSAVIAVPCFILQSSTQCPQQNNLAIQSTSAYSDSISFDNFVTSRLDNNTNYISEFNSSFQCPLYNGAGQRFHLSIFCALLTKIPQNCDEPIQDRTTRVNLCKETCEEATESLSSLFNSPTCLRNASALASSQRNSTLTAYTEFCNTLQIRNSSEGSCLDGSGQPNEQFNCGFFTLREGEQFCANSVGSKPSCCDRLGGQLIQSQAPSSSTAFIPILVVGIVIFLIILFFTLRWAMAKRNDPEDEAFVPEVVKENPRRTSSFVPTPAPTLNPSQPIMKVIAAYDSRMVDELTIRPGDRIQMIESYDDGWAYGMKLGDGEGDMGSFPLVTTVLESEN